jgi:imidazolonepropionase-like amidohydrolase
MLRRLMVVLLASAMAASVQAESLVFSAVRLVDIDQGRVSEPVRIGIADGLIVDPDTIGTPSRIIETPGFLIPGLAEMHAHVPPMRLGEQQVHDTLALYLAHGITTIRGMLGESGHLDLRQTLASGELVGPRLLTAGPSFNGNSISSPQQARAMVRAQAEAGYDLLKLHPGLWPEAFAAIVETATAVGIDYSGHISVAVGLDRVLASHQGTIDHLDAYAQAMVPPDHPLYGTDPGFFGINLVAGMNAAMIPDLARRTAAAGIANVPTQTLLENIYSNDVQSLLARPAMRYIPSEVSQRWQNAIERLRAATTDEDRQQFIELRRQLILALHEAGGVILLGADAPQVMNVPGDAVHHELEIYVESGLSPAAALATGTTNIARYLNQSIYGCLNQGCVADLVLLAANPLEDISHVRRIEGVMRAGRWFDRAELDDLLDAVAERAANVNQG